MTPTEMELRVAIALFRYESKQIMSEKNETGSCGDVYFGLARAAIQAMREPTTGMKQAAIDAAPMYNLEQIKRLEKQGGRSTLTDNQLAEVYQAMIDAASPPEAK